MIIVILKCVVPLYFKISPIFYVILWFVVCRMQAWGSSSHRAGTRESSVLTYGLEGWQEEDTTLLELANKRWMARVEADGIVDYFVIYWTMLPVLPVPYTVYV